MYTLTDIFFLILSTLGDTRLSLDILGLLRNRPQKSVITDRAFLYPALTWLDTAHLSLKVGSASFSGRLGCRSLPVV